jgi:pimeloyl-ACP methyl ester carboxylesterase
MTIQIAPNVGPAGIDIAYERLGDPSGPVVLLVMGLGAQLINWPDGFCDELVKRGLQVIRFDNRDVGQSTHLHSAPIPNFMAAMAGDFSSVSYRLSDMAADAVGLLDVLGVERAHVVGASLGGYISQTIAIEHPQRVQSLTLIMTSTGDPRVGQPHPEAMQVFAGPTPTTRQQAIDKQLFASKLLGSPGFPREPEVVAERAGRAFDRGYDAVGMVRQAVAVVASGDRTSRLRELKVPTVVIHGKADMLVDISGGRALAAAIPGAELIEIEGMGHDLPRPMWPLFATKIAALTA